MEENKQMVRQISEDVVANTEFIQKVINQAKTEYATLKEENSSREKHLIRVCFFLIIDISLEK